MWIHQSNLPVIMMTVIRCGCSFLAIIKYIKAFLVGDKASEIYYYNKDLLSCGFWSILHVFLPFYSFSFLFLNQSNFQTMLEQDSVQLSSLLPMKGTTETLSVQKIQVAG